MSIMSDMRTLFKLKVILGLVKYKVRSKKKGRSKIVPKIVVASYAYVIFCSMPFINHQHNTNAILLFCLINFV